MHKRLSLIIKLVLLIGIGTSLYFHMHSVQKLEKNILTMDNIVENDLPLIEYTSIISILHSKLNFTFQSGSLVDATLIQDYQKN